MGFAGEEERAAFLAAVVTSADDPIVSKRLDGTIIDWNGAAERLYGYTAEEAVGQAISLIEPPDRRGEFSDVVARLVRGERVEPFETVRQAKSGDLFAIRLTVSPVIDLKTLRMIGVSTIHHNITEAKRDQIRLATKYTITHVLSKAHSLSDALEPILHALSECLESEIGEYWQIADARLKRAAVVTKTRADTLAPFVEAGERLSLTRGEGLMGIAWQTGRAHWVRDLVTRHEMPRREVAAALHLRSGIAFPVLARGEVTGVFAFFSQRRSRSSQPLVDLVTSVGLEIGRFVEQRRLAAERDRLAAVVAASDDAIIGWTARGEIIGWNSGAERLYGYTAEEMLGGSILDLVHPDRREHWRREAAKVMAGQSLDQYETERVRKDGSLVDVSLTVSPVFDEQGAVAAAVTVGRDVTAQKRAAELKNMLTRELNHRLRNILTLVQFLAQQCARRSGTLADFEAAFETRLDALARIYGYLADLNWESVDLASLVRLTNSFHSRTIAAVGPEVMLSANESVGLGLVLHELATNAIKHGALSNPDGEIAFSWDIVERDGVPELDISWCERKGPPVGAPVQGGFGTQLIRSTIEHNFRGTANVEYLDDGVAWRFRIPRPEYRPTP